MTQAVVSKGFQGTAVNGLDSNLSDIVLDGKKLHPRIGEAVTTSKMSRTISGQSTISLGINDPDRFLLSSNGFLRTGDLTSKNQSQETTSPPVFMEFDELWFRLINVDKAGDIFTLLFADRESEALKRYHTSARASRDDSTLAQFIKRQCLRAAPHMQFVCHDLGDRGRIHGLASDNVDDLRLANRDPGIPKGSKLTVKGSKIYETQRHILNVGLGVAESLGGAGGVSSRVAEALICAAIGESTVSYARNGQYVGPWQGSDKIFKPTSAREEAHAFLVGGQGYGDGAIRLAREHTDWSPGTIAFKVEGDRSNFSSDAEAEHFYQQWIDEAKAIIKAYGGITQDPNALGTHDLTVKQAVYSQGPPVGPAGEDTYAMANRYATLVQRRFCIVAGVAFYENDWNLIRSMPRMTITEDTPGIDDIDFGVAARGVKPDQVKVYCRAPLWGAPPLTVVNLDTSMDVVDGAWIVGQIDRADMTQDATVITLLRPHKQAAEPASTVTTRSATEVSKITKEGGVSVDISKLGSIDPTSHVGRAYTKAKAIDKKRLPYVFGGGHGSATFAPTAVTTGGPVGYDCSSGVSAILHAGDMTDAVMATTQLETWGLPGKGNHLTVWVIDEGGGNGHTFAEFDLPTGVQYFEFHHTGTIGGLESTRDTTGFSPRHYPGT